MTRPRQESFPTSAPIFRADYVRVETQDEQAAMSRASVSPEPAPYSRVIVGDMPQTEGRFASGKVETQFQDTGRCCALASRWLLSAATRQSLRIRLVFIGLVAASG